MRHTFDRSSGADFTLITSVGSGNDTTTIYGQNRDFEVFDLCGGHAIPNLIHWSGGSGIDVIHGGGFDRLWGDNGSTNINGTSRGHDTIYGGGDSNATIWGEGGNDYLDGGVGNNALWGGAGGDTIYGGPGSDFLYGGPGNNDMLFGGTGVDCYYGARTDGQGDQIYDECRGTGNVGQAGERPLVFAGYDSIGNLPSGTGVFEIDGSITDNVGVDEMVHAYDLDGAGSGTLWRLEVLQGPDDGNYVEFDRRDISAIGLWNHDAGKGQQAITVYQWDGSTYSLV